MVQSSVNQEMYDSVTSMEQEILSRGVLTTIINTYDLYKRERTRVPIEDILDEMHKKILIEPVVGSSQNTNTRSIPAFSVKFSYSDRYLAQRVVQDLVGRFIDANVRNRTNQSFQTTQFMKDEQDQAKKDLDEIENKLTAFRVQNNGRLPDQVQGMMQSMQALQSQVTALDSAISRANEEKLQLEANLRIVRDQITELNKLPPVETSASAVERNERLLDAEREVSQWEDQLRILRQQYSDNYPDVQTALGRLEAAKQKRDDIIKDDEAKKEQSAKEAAKRSKDPAPRLENPAVANERRNAETNAKQIQSQIAGKELEIEDYNKQMDHARQSLKTYQARIEAVPLGEKEYDDLLRDRRWPSSATSRMNEKLEKAEISQEMERRKQGETAGTAGSGVAAANSHRTEAADGHRDRRGSGSAAGDRDRRRARDERHLAQESERRAGVHADGDSGQHSAARKRFRGAPPQASGLARLDHGVSGRGGDDGGIGGVLLRDQSLARLVGGNKSMSRVHDALRRAEQAGMLSPPVHAAAEPRRTAATATLDAGPNLDRIAGAGGGDSLPHRAPIRC